MGYSTRAERAFVLLGLGRMVKLVNVSCWAPSADFPELSRFLGCMACVEWLSSSMRAVGLRRLICLS